MNIPATQLASQPTDSFGLASHKAYAVFRRASGPASRNPGEKHEIAVKRCCFVLENEKVPLLTWATYLLKAFDTQKDAESVCAPVPAGIITCRGVVSKAGQKLLGREATELVKCFSPAFKLSMILAQPEMKSLSSRLAVDKVFWLAQWNLTQRHQYIFHNLEVPWRQSHRVTWGSELVLDQIPQKD